MGMRQPEYERSQAKVSTFLMHGQVRFTSNVDKKARQFGNVWGKMRPCF